MAKIISTGKGIHSAEFYKKKQKRKKFFKIALLVLFLAFISSVVFLLRLDRLQISEVVIPGEDIVGKTEAKEIVEQILREKYIWLIPKTNALIYPRGHIRDMLLRKFPRYKSVEFDLEGTKLLNVEIIERIAGGLYCDGFCYYVDNDGLIFALSPEFSSPVYFTYTTREPIADPVGKNLLPKEEFALTQKFMKDLSTIQVEVSALELSENEYRYRLVDGGDLIMLRGQDSTLTLSNLETFLNASEIRAQADFLDKVLYLDLRVDNKVFYKFK